MAGNVSYESSVRGCWMGKNIGGTLGAPFEGKTEINDIDFYVQKDLFGRPEPNDDLDLQLLWLIIAERHGIYHITPRLMGEYWISNIIGPWNEYSTCRFNCINGFYPPLSGAVDNGKWHWSNGAWIRSEIWACLFPGDPDEALKFAWLDSCCDHAGEGIYAEMFTTALESAAFVEKDLRKLVAIGLAKIPPESRLRESIELVCKCCDAGEAWQDARNKVVELNADLGYFQAPANVAFAILGLLYGEGDFGRTVCLAADCGDDTDCTAATAGAVWGIIYGIEAIPEKWIAPIGNTIVTGAIQRFGLKISIPKTIDELTHRTMRLRRQIDRENPRPPVENLHDDAAAKEIWKRSSYELGFDVSYAKIGVEYVEGVHLKPGEPLRVRLWLSDAIPGMQEMSFAWRLPEGWNAVPNEVRLSSLENTRGSIDTAVIPPEKLDAAMYYLEMEVRSDTRNYPTTLRIPFRRADSVSYPKYRGDRDFTERMRLKRMIAGE
jgi:ADP-ribosylglycohydrolase